MQFRGVVDGSDIQQKRPQKATAGRVNSFHCDQSRSECIWSGSDGQRTIGSRAGDLQSDSRDQYCILRVRCDRDLTVT